MKLKLFLLMTFAWAGMAQADQQCNGSKNCDLDEEIITFAQNAALTTVPGCFNIAHSTSSLTGCTSNNTQNSLSAVPFGFDYDPIEMWVYATNTLNAATENCVIKTVCIAPDVSTTAYTGSISTGLGNDVETKDTGAGVDLVGDPCPGGHAIRVEASGGSCSVLQAAAVSIRVRKIKNGQ